MANDRVDNGGEDDVAGDADLADVAGPVARALDAWAPLAPPADFADRVLAARDAESAAAPPVAPEAQPAPRRLRRWRGVAAVVVAGTAAAAVAAFALRSPRAPASGALRADRRTTAAIGSRGVAVAEPDSELSWRVDDRGAADVVQRRGDVFYRIERGGPFVVHTPGGDIRVTGTCFRIEVEDMNNRNKLLLSGLTGAALASAVLVTVYEGHVIAETRAAKTELAAGAHAALTGDGAVVTGGGALASAAGAPLDEAHATREQLIARAQAQEAQLVQLRSRLAQLERPPVAGAQAVDVAEPGRLWHDPSPEKLAEWVATCHVRTDEPALDRYTPGGDPESDRGVQPGERAAYDAAMTETQQRWKALVRSLYIEVTGDTTGADSLSSESMAHEIEDKSPPGEHNQVLQRIARERAGLDAPPVDLARTSPLERLMRAHALLGDQSEAALAGRVGADRAHAIRGDGWGARWESSGCPSDAGGK